VCVCVCVCVNADYRNGNKTSWPIYARGGRVDDLRHAQFRRQLRQEASISKRKYLTLV
jgi:hypothetical protein